MIFLSFSVGHGDRTRQHVHFSCCFVGAFVCVCCLCVLKCRSYRPIKSFSCSRSAMCCCWCLVLSVPRCVHFYLCWGIHNTRTHTLRTESQQTAAMFVYAVHSDNVGVWVCAYCYIDSFEWWTWCCERRSLIFTRSRVGFFGFMRSLLSPLSLCAFMHLCALSSSSFQSVILFEHNKHSLFTVINFIIFSSPFLSHKLCFHHSVTSIDRWQARDRHLENATKQQESLCHKWYIQFVVLWCAYMMRAIYAFQLVCELRGNLKRLRSMSLCVWVRVLPFVSFISFCLFSIASDSMCVWHIDTRVGMVCAQFWVRTAFN